MCFLKKRYFATITKYTQKIIMKNIKQNPMYKYLLILTIASAIGLHGWRTLFNNFAVDIIGLNGFQIGIIQAIRELPGFLTLCAIFLLIFIKEHKLSAIAIICMGIGIILTGYIPSFFGLIITTLLMSFGFHYYESTNQSLILQYFNKHNAPLVLGKQRSIMSLVCIIVGISIFLLSSFLSYKIIFFSIGILVFSTGIYSLFKNPIQKENNYQRKKIIIKKKYTLFYILTLLSGARRQIFMVFSILLLVKNFNFTIKQITLLFVINNIINYFVAPLVAKAIKKFGEKTILSSEYRSLIIIFIMYAFCPYKYLVTILYLLDHISFNGAMAIRTYFQKIATQKDISSNTAISFTINHIAAIILPVIGGYLWIINYKIPFIFGAILSLISLITVQFIYIDKNLIAK